MTLNDNLDDISRLLKLEVILDNYFFLFLIRNQLKIVRIVA